MKKILNGIEMKILSIDIGGTNVKYGVFHHSNGNLENINLGYFKTPHSFEEFVLSLEVRLSGQKFDFVVVAVPGVYDFEKDEMVYAPNIKMLNGIRIAEQLNDFFKCDVLVENDGNLAALGEYYFVEKMNIPNFVLITLGTGVGGGIIFNGKILSGKTTVGEIGHITINFNGRKCGCGKNGCFEAYCGMSGLIETYREVSDTKVAKVDDIFKRCSNKDILAKIAVDIFSYHLASGIVSVANIFSPNIIKIGGGVSFYSNFFYKKTVKYFSKMIFPAFKNNVRLEISELKNNAGIYGGAALVLSKVD